MNPVSLHPDARVWVYAAERALEASEQAIVQQKSEQFVEQWTAHNQQLQAKALLLEARFLVLAVDESRAGASGCSIDKSVHFVQALGQALGLDFFNRMRFSYRDAAGDVHTISREAFQTRYREGAIHGQTVVFDPLVKSWAELQNSFEKPLADSWHQRML